MAPIIEARSLSALTVLAANPPQYPRNPTHKSLEALVLYIAKVPGSRDVFLTTMKPQQRVVTAQDVESSLYYLHVDSADDEEIREALQATQEAKRLSGIGEYDLRHSTESAGLKRKPLPMSPQLALGTRPEVPPKVYPRFQIPDYQSRELSKFARKPLPSPTQEPPVLDAIPPLHLRKLPSPTQGPPVMDTTSQLPARKPLGPRPLHLRNSYSDTTESIAEYPAQNEGKQVSEQERASDFSITIIRRDPTSGGQWNVGKLTAGAAAMRRKSSLGSSGLQTPQADHSVSIEISTEGYNRFIDYSATHSTPEPNQNSHSHSGLDTLRSEKFPSYSTKRLIQPRLAKQRKVNSGQHSHSAYTVSELRFNLPGSKVFTKPPTDRKRPPLPTSNSKRSSFPLSSQAHSRSQSLDGRISEFRESREEEEEFEDWMDLSLGREQAGGGMRGKQAKLGKLIVEDEGLKMLDLVVAANMGVWWGVWGWDLG